MDTLVALCDILECAPNDLITVEVSNVQVGKAVGAPTEPAPRPPTRRTTIRRPTAT